MDEEENSSARRLGKKKTKRETSEKTKSKGWKRKRGKRCRVCKKDR